MENISHLVYGLCFYAQNQLDYNQLSKGGEKTLVLKGLKWNWWTWLNLRTLWVFFIKIEFFMFIFYSTQHIPWLWKLSKGFSWFFAASLILRACYCHFRQALKMLLSKINKGVVSLAVSTCQQIPVPPMELVLQRSPHF